MRADVNGAQPDDSATDGQEYQNDDDCEKDSEDLAAGPNLETFPLDVFRGRYLIALDQ